MCVSRILETHMEYHILVPVVTMIGLYVIIILLLKGDRGTAIELETIYLHIICSTAAKLIISALHSNPGL